MSNRFSRPQNGALDAKARLGPAGSPITSATKKEERSALLASMPILDPPAQLRLYLTLGTRPPGELLKHIPSAIQLDDCWKFARLLATPTRAIDVTALLDASQAMMQKKSTPSVKRSTKGLLAVAKLWRTGAPPAVPTEATAVAFLRVATHLLDHRVNQTEWSMGKSNPPKQLLTNLMNISLELIEFQPSVRSLILGAELLTKAVNRHSFDLDALLPSKKDTDPTGALWVQLTAELKSALTLIRLDDAQTLLRAMSSFPRKTREFRELVAEHLATSENLDKACRQLLFECTDSTGQEENVLAFPPELHQDVETTELARMLMKAWDVLARLAPGEELAQEVITTLDRLFGLRLNGEQDKAIPYSPPAHEFEAGAAVSDSVHVVRPGVHKVMRDKSSVIFKAIVRAAL